MFKFITIIITLTAIVLGFIIHEHLMAVPDLPEFDYQKRWGDDPKPDIEDESIRPFKVEFNDTMIADLKNRLKNKRAFRRPLDGIQSEYGINTVYLDRVLNYWLEKYDFKGRAAKLNTFPHYKTNIQGLDIHYIRAVPENQQGMKVLPLLLLHGFPSSSKEFASIIPTLTKPRKEYNFVFEVIAADLPGFGYSQGTNKPGLNPVQIAIIMRNLMRRLGFSKFYIQAGDWGSQTATHMCTLFPDEILGFHTNMPFSSRTISFVKLLLGSMFPRLVGDPKYLQRIYPLKDFLKYLIRESGYFHLQATKPDTIGAALTDTPVGMAAYIMEKMGACSNRDQLDTEHNGLASLNIDDVLDTITILWANEQITTSVRIYAEGYSSAPELSIVHNIPTKVPTAAINFKYEVVYQTDWVLRDKFLNLVRSTTLDIGGHFAAMHTPVELVDDIFASVEEFNKFHAK